MGEFEKGDLLTLEDGLRYVLTGSVEYEGVIYHYLVNVLDDDKINYENSVFVYEEREGEDVYICNVTDSNTIELLGNILFFNILEEEHPAEMEDFYNELKKYFEKDSN